MIQCREALVLLCELYFSWGAVFSAGSHWLDYSPSGSAEDDPGNQLHDTLTRMKNQKWELDSKDMFLSNQLEIHIEMMLIN